MGLGEDRFLGVMVTGLGGGNGFRCTAPTVSLSCPRHSPVTSRFALAHPLVHTLGYPQLQSISPNHSRLLITFTLTLT